MPFNLSGEWIPEKKRFAPIKIWKEKRKNSYVTLIKNVPVEGPALKELLSELKKYLATGGSLKDLVLEIQGDKVAEVQLFLKAKGLVS